MMADNEHLAFELFMQGIKAASKEGLGCEVFLDFMRNMGVRELGPTRIDKAMRQALWEWDC